MRCPGCLSIHVSHGGYAAPAGHDQLSGDCCRSQRNSHTVPDHYYYTFITFACHSDKRTRTEFWIDNCTCHEPTSCADQQSTRAHQEAEANPKSGARSKPKANQETLKYI